MRRLCLEIGRRAVKQLILSNFRKRAGALAAAVLTAAALGAWGVATTLVTRAAAIEQRSETSAKVALVGSYRVTGTDADGVAYRGAHIVDISLAPSGALEVDWDDGRQFGVAHVVDNVLAVAGSSKGRTVILTMTVNPDGSLSGKWSRRTDRGSQGTETWTRIGG
jgi:hypothetical protein